MPKTVADFLQALREATSELFPLAILTVSIVRFTRLKARIEIDAESFIDVFFREETQRVDFALIIAGKRLFGIDNLDGWHYHPLDEPTQHIPCPEPTMREALGRVKEAVEAVSPKG